MHPGQPAQTLRHENISEIQTSQDLMRRWRGHPSGDVGLHTHGWSCRCCAPDVTDSLARREQAALRRRRHRRKDPRQECPANKTANDAPAKKTAATK